MGAHPGVSSREPAAYYFESEMKTVGKKKSKNNTIHHSLESQGHMEAIDKINLPLPLKYKYQLDRAVNWEEEVCLFLPRVANNAILLLEKTRLILVVSHIPGHLPLSSPCVLPTLLLSFCLVPRVIQRTLSSFRSLKNSGSMNHGPEEKAVWYSELNRHLSHQKCENNACSQRLLFMLPINLPWVTLC